MIDGLILVLKRVRSANICGGKVSWFDGLSRGIAGLRRPTPVLVNGKYPVTRSGLKTVPDGEFDWGGTSVKR